MGPVLPEHIHLAIVLDYMFDVILIKRFVRTLVSLSEWAVTVANCFTINNKMGRENECHEGRQCDTHYSSNLGFSGVSCTFVTQANSQSGSDLLPPFCHVFTSATVSDNF